MAQAISKPNLFPYINPTLPCTHTYLPMKMEQCSETSAYKIQTPRNRPKEGIQHSVHGESLKSIIVNLLYSLMFSYGCTVYFIYTSLLILF